MSVLSDLEDGGWKEQALRAILIYRLLCNHKDGSSDPQHPHKHIPITPAVWDQRQVDLSAGPSSKSQASFRFSKRLSEKKKSVDKKLRKYLVSASALMHTFSDQHTYMYVRVHADAYRDSQDLQAQPPSFWLVSGYCRKESTD